ncbi:Fe-only nitrogenase accessory protein AnfO [Clostridium pasteurianum]|uniref:Fe-only nitrogenase accessory protein AnfO n=1 Tax=Clostridium pasteurianum BC1 TaxID=86416 RepID=R4K527_CLOPA|nr:Fe-only nitrogenase accessory protein AnfO [Clostridium pasteurianum]AGK98267.1 Fe-only nitrogenase accessory protein AnfO [Clostridium pasteurianum BC1]
MFDQIAVLTGKDGETGSIYEPGMVVIYEKEGENWIVKNKIIFNVNTSKGMGAVRERMVLLIESLGNCSVFLGRRVDGIPYSVLKKSGFTIAEASGNPEELLDELREMMIENKEKAAKKKKVEDVSIEPVALDQEGAYFINLERVQNSNPGISSKKVLLPFLRNKPFKEIKIFCSHTPQWLEGELLTLNMKLEVKELVKGEFEVRIYNQNQACDEKSVINK